MKNKTTLLLLTFAAGAIIGAAIVWMLCNCCCKTICCSQNNWIVGDTTKIHLISVKKANTCFKTYLNTPESADTVKAFSINADQFTAMKLIAKSDPTVHGFRIYMGIDSITPVRMVVGTGSPDKVNIIYVTSDVSSGLCPHICDKTSPIMDK